MAPSGASDEARTRYLHLGKVALYQMSYTRIWVPRRWTAGDGASGRNRTNDTRIFSPLLYQLSYRGKSFFLKDCKLENKSEVFFAYFLFQKKVSGDSEGAFASSFGWRIRQLQSGEISGDSEGT